MKLRRAPFLLPIPWLLEWSHPEESHTIYFFLINHTKEMCWQMAADANILKGPTGQHMLLDPCGNGKIMNHSDRFKHFHDLSRMTLF